MRMPQKMFDDLKASVLAIVEASPEGIEQSYYAAGLTPKRFRWDALHASKWDTRAAYNAGLNDAHMDTALRAIFGHKGDA